jgi:hypothetical protein
MKPAARNPNGTHPIEKSRLAVWRFERPLTRKGRLRQFTGRRWLCTLDMTHLDSTDIGSARLIGV